MTDQEPTAAAIEENPKQYPNIRSLPWVFWYQVLSLGMYQFYWLFRNYKHFKIHKNLSVHPSGELAELVIWLWIVPMFLEYLVSLFFEAEGLFALCFLILVYCICAAGYYRVFYRQFNHIKNYLGDQELPNPKFPLHLTLILAGAFFVPIIFETLLEILEQTFHTFFSTAQILEPLIALVLGPLISGWALYQAQKYLNHIWNAHPAEGEGPVATPASLGEQVLVIGIFMFSFAVWIFLVIGAATLFRYSVESMGAN